MTEEEKEILFSNLISEAIDETSSPHVSSSITTRTLGLLTGLGSQLTDDYVLVNNEQLTKEFSHIVKSYGYSDFHGLYSFSILCEQELEDISKGGQKDFSNLKKVKRTVIRNGKPVSMMLYQKDDDDATENELDKGRKSSSETTESTGEVSARELSEETVDTKKLPKEVKTFIKQNSHVSVDSHSDKTSTYVLSDGQSVRGVYTIVQQGDYLYLANIIADKQTKGLGIKAFFTLLKRAIDEDKGARVDAVDSELAIQLFTEYGLVQSDNYYEITAEDLKKELGDF